MDTVTTRIDSIVDEFADLDSREKLELLIDFSNRLPPLPAAYQALKAENAGRVHECQTPVYLWPELDQGGMRLIAEVAEEAPTVKGFVSMLAEAVAGRPQTEAADLPDDFLERIGLDAVLGMLRSRGLQAITHRVRRELTATP